MADFLRDRFYDDVENEPDIEKFTSFYKWIDDSISIAVQQLVPASARFAEKINNVIESHVLERNKYVHQLPTLTTFQSTEGSFKGISEMKYDWKNGHAPFFPDEEQDNVLWQRERREKTGLREALRKSISNNTMQSSGLTRKEIDGSTRISDVYAVRKFSKTYDISMVSQNTIHGGVNFERKKNIQLFHESIAPAGALGDTSGVPQNVITVGVGEGNDLIRGARNTDNQPRKKKFNASALIGNREGQEYGYDIHANAVIPMNLMSGTVHSGYNFEIKSKYSSDVVVSNLHHDVVGNYNERSIQSPFTEAHIGGLQYRHIDVNKYDSLKSTTVSYVSSGVFPTASIQFTASVLETKLNEGTGSSVTIRDGDGTLITALYSNVFDLFDNQWTNMDDLVFIINNKLNMTTKKVSENFLELTQSVTGNFYNYQIQSSSHGFITASGFDGGTPLTSSTFTVNLDGPENRPEGWGLVFKDHPSVGDNDGAFGFIGADYGPSYPSPVKLKATRYREETAKRPVNIKNIKTVSGSQKAGNYSNEIQIFSVAPVHQKTWALEAYDNPNVQILPLSISQSLPLTTHYQTLMGIATYLTGNVFGTHSNNRQPDGAVRVPGSAGTVASGSFEVSGATVVGQTASGSFNVTGSPYAGAFASGSFEITSSMVQGTEAVGSFTMSGAFSPAVSASYDFQVIGRTILGEEASGSFQVSGAYIAPAFATASFDVSALPVGGKRAYHIFDACYETAVDGYLVGLGRNTDANKVEVDYDDSIASGNTVVYPITFQKAAEVSGSSEFFSGSASFTSNQEFVLNFWISASANAINADKKKYIYQSRDSAADRKSIEIFFNEDTPGPRRLTVRRYVESGATYRDYLTDDNVCTDQGLPWTMITVMAHGGGETTIYVNATGAAHTPAGSGLATFNSITVDEHHVMSDAGSDSSWEGNARISDFMMWNKNLTSGSLANAFVEDIYNNGIFEPSVPSGSLLGWRYTFGDDPADSDTSGIHATYGSGSNLTGSYTEHFTNSYFAVTKSASQYFADLKTAIENHNSDRTYFTVNYDEYNTTASSTLTTFVSGTYELAFVPGSVSSSIGIGDTLQFARFYVNSKQESDNANYDITASVSNSGKSGQERGFIQVHTGSQSSAQQNALDAFDYSKISIDSNNIFFDDHANQVFLQREVQSKDLQQPTTLDLKTQATRQTRRYMGHKIYPFPFGTKRMVATKNL